jgi:hypothetical protein
MIGRNHTFEPKGADRIWSGPTPSGSAFGQPFFYHACSHWQARAFTNPCAHPA